ncbi:tyrosinase family oxidase copper chaperone [Streptomyces sp. NBC_00223]|uniref:tyrosinase family oxidase copper chaperone n=1 Tax=Streptomyces sp. NBC_00223 TaxID=2976008 RepID=UPI002E2D3FF8|nr:tyrosinase family oxidase copper chaperone [Streptomyces sp. NBC_00223]
MLRTGLTTVTAAAATTAALWPMLAAGEPGTTATDTAYTANSADTADGKDAGAPGAGAAQTPPADGTGAVLFDEVYRGRRIQGYDSAAPSGVEILVDGRPLEVMRRVDGSLISMANHYQPYPTPRETARAAVDVIGRAPLSAIAPHHH